MSVNASTYYYGFCVDPQRSSINYSFPSELYCFTTTPGCFIITVYTITMILLFLPLCSFILYHGLQPWCQQRSSCTAATTTSHSNCFTYHLLIMELLNVFGCFLCFCGIYWNYIQIIMVWFSLFNISWYGETLFHVLTCVEHYLAVVHPVTYLSLRKQRGIRIRNIIIGCIWLLSLGFTSVAATGNSYFIVDSCILISSLIIISFCSLSVLCTLVRPGPGKRGREWLKVDHSKQRAFYTIMAILGVLFLRCSWNFAGTVLSLLNGYISDCVFAVFAVWINVPSSLLLPLLFLQRAGMLACKNSIK